MRSIFLPSLFFPLTVVLLSAFEIPRVFADSPNPNTRFGTIANFRQFGGSSNFTDGKIYLGVDGDKYMKNEVYRFIGPDGKPVIQSNNWKELVGQQPDTSTRLWWDFQLNQMVNAGLDFLAIASFGQKRDYECDGCSEEKKAGCRNDSHNCPLNPEFQGEALKKIFNEESFPIQVGLYVDTTGPYRLYNWDRLRAAYKDPSKWCSYRFFSPGNAKDPLQVIQPMPMTSENALRYMYGAVIYPFYSHFNDSVSRKHWLTHNGKTIEEGGRPIIWIYGTNPQVCSNFDQAGAAFEAIKNQFKTDFGVEPFLVIETQWFILANNNPSLQNAADATESFLGDWLWGKKNPPDPNSWVFKDYRISRIAPGIKAAPNHWGEQNRATLGPIMGKRWMYVDGTERPDESYFLQREWDSGMKNNPDLAIIGFWDDQEGESIAEMADYERKGGGYLPPNYYIKKVARVKILGVNFHGRLNQAA